MKKHLIIIILVLMANKGFSQLISYDEVKNIRNSKLNNIPNNALGNAIKQHWTFNDIAESSAADSNPDTYFMRLNSVKVTSLPQGQGSIKYKTITTGIAIEVCRGKKVVHRQYLPTFESKVTEEILAFGVMAIQDVFEIMHEKEIGVLKVTAELKKRGPELKEKTLVIPDGWLGKGTDETTIKDNYPAKAAVIDYDGWREIILDKLDYAYVMVVPIPSGKDYTYVHYLVDAASGKLYGMLYPKVAVSMGNVNLTKSNSGYIKDKNIKMYAEVLD